MTAIIEKPAYWKPKKLPPTVNCPIHEVSILDITKQVHKKGFSWHEYIHRCFRWKDFPGCTDPNKTRAMHNFVIKRLSELIVEDIIAENVQFDFRFRGKVFLSLLIADRDKDSYLYRYNIKQRGHDFIPFCITSSILWKKTSKYFLLRLDNRYKKRLAEEIANGREYEQAPKVKFNKKKQYGLQLGVYRSQGRSIPNSEKVSVQAV